MDPRAPGAIRDHQHEAFFLLLERSATADGQSGSMGFSQLAIPRIIGAGDLGAGARTAAETARSLAFRWPGCHLSCGLLLRISACAVSGCRLVCFTHQSAISNS